MTSSPDSAAVEALIPKFQLERLLNQDQAGRRISLLGTIDSKPALLIAERAPFTTSTSTLTTFASSLSNIKNLGHNDIYAWFLANSHGSNSSSSPEATQPPDLKLNLIYPCTEQHIKKYSQQGLRMVTETPEIYQRYVRPFMAQKRAEGRLNWVFNIIEGRTEQEDVIYREHGEEGFLILPDLNWDRRTLSSLHLLGIVERRDIWSVRDLNPQHLTWLQHMRQKLLDSTVKLYPELEADQLKLYVHYQPTYYHFHIHIVHVALEAGLTQATGKALGLENIIGQLKGMESSSSSAPSSSTTTATADTAPLKGMAHVDIAYHLGEASELWTEIFQPLKEGREVTVASTRLG